MPHVRIIGTHHCGNTHHKAFKNCRPFQNVLVCCYYANRVVASFVHQIKSEDYGRN